MKDQLITAQSQLRQVEQEQTIADLAALHIVERIDYITTETRPEMLQFMQGVMHFIFDSGKQQLGVNHTAANESVPSGDFRPLLDTVSGHPVDQVAKRYLWANTSDAPHRGQTEIGNVTTFPLNMRGILALVTRLETSDDGAVSYIVSSV